MKRVVVEKPGGFDRLVIKDAPDLEPSPTEVIVDVEAAGVNYADSIVRMGYYQSAKKLAGYPLTPGFEFAGRITKLGNEVKGRAIGQLVFGVSFFNSYATQIRVPTYQVFPRPSQLSVIEAATFPVAFLTAWYAAVQLGQVQAGMTVLVHSAAGGVGGAITQVCKTLGAHVIGIVGNEKKISTAKDMGCDQIINKQQDRLWAKATAFAPNGYDRIFDATGVATLRESYQHLAPTGRLIAYGFHSMFSHSAGSPNPVKLFIDYFRTPRFNPIHMADENKSVMAFNLSFLFGQSDLLQAGMTQLLEWLRQGKIHALPVREYHFTDVRQAHRDIESGQTVGKLVLIP